MTNGIIWGENSLSRVCVWVGIWQKSKFHAHLSISFRERMRVASGWLGGWMGGWVVFRLGELGKVENIQVFFVGAAHWALGGNTNLKLCVQALSSLIYSFHQSGGVRVFSLCCPYTFSYIFINCSFCISSGDNKRGPK